MSRSAAWPALPLDAWEETYQTLQRWTQVVGKIRLARTPYVNHWWNVTLYVTPRGLTTAAMAAGERSFSIDFDFVRHRLVIAADDGTTTRIPLAPMSVAAFYGKVMESLEAMGLATSIWPVPVEVTDTVPFPEDTVHAAYDPAMVERLHTILVQVDRVMRRFRGGFLGKSSPVHFFWGAFDLAVTRFSGRAVPEPPADPVMGPAYSHEVISHGWWPGGDWPMGGRVEAPVFYAYAVPEPAGFQQAALPSGGAYDATFGEYILPYDTVAEADDPEAVLLDFMERTYAVGADAAGWDRAALEVTSPPGRS